MNSRGISMTEVLIGVVLFSVAGTLLAGTLVSTNDVFLNQNAQVNQGLSLNQAATKISDSIKASAGVVTQYPATGTAQYTTGNGVLVLKIPGLNGNGTVLESVYDYVVLAPDNSNPKILRRRIFITSPSTRKAENQVLSTSLKSLQFSYVNGNNSIVPPAQAVRVGFVINLLEGGSENQSSASGAINLKNIQ